MLIPAPGWSAHLLFFCYITPMNETDTLSMRGGAVEKGWKVGRDETALGNYLERNSLSFSIVLGEALHRSGIWHLYLFCGVRTGKPAPCFPLRSPAPTSCTQSRTCPEKKGSVWQQGGRRALQMFLFPLVFFSSPRIFLRHLFSFFSFSFLREAKAWRGNFVASRLRYPKKAPDKAGVFFYRSARNTHRVPFSFIFFPKTKDRKREETYVLFSLVFLDGCAGYATDGRNCNDRKLSSRCRRKGTSRKGRLGKLWMCRLKKRPCFASTASPPVENTPTRRKRVPPQKRELSCCKVGPPPNTYTKLTPTTVLTFSPIHAPMLAK